MRIVMNQILNLNIVLLSFFISWPDSYQVFNIKACDKYERYVRNARCSGKHLFLTEN